MSAPNQEITSNEFGKSSDRVMVIDCDGECGVSDPAPDVQVPTDFDVSSNDDRISMWKNFEPLHSDGYIENYNVTADTYVVWKGTYCPSMNIPVQDHTLHPYHSTHQCWRKCHKEDCVGPNCHCDGYWQNVHGPETSVLCLSKEMCMEACSALGDYCKSVDMYVTRHFHVFKGWKPTIVTKVWTVLMLYFDLFMIQTFNELNNLSNVFFQH